LQPQPILPAPARQPGSSQGVPVPNPWLGFLELWRCKGVRWTLAIFLINGIASAIPATLLLFFVADILQESDRTPQFLLAYFLAAALGMPLWSRLALRYGLKAAWLMGMGLSILAFIWAWRLGPGDAHAFFVVCIATGLALGADLAVPPALLAKVLAAPDAPKARDGAAFGLWNLATKLNLAAAAGLALPALGLLGYAPGGAAGEPAARESAGVLAFMYAVLPCVLKLFAALLLALSPLARRLPSEDSPSPLRNSP
jgi:Na+/melibiose symporter-like transporter